MAKQRTHDWGWLTLLLVLWPIGCTAGGGSFGGGDDDSPGGAGGSSPTFGGGAAGGFHFDGGPGGGSGDDCSDASKLVYVIDADNMLYSFDPTVANVSAFVPIGLMSCPGDGPNSMAVSRNDVAYVLYGNSDPFAPDGFACVDVFPVAIDDAQCGAGTAFTCGAQGFNKFGMGYATNGADTSEETLFLGSSLDAKFGSLDPASGAVQLRGNLPVQGPEFTGNGNGELWGFFPYGTPPQAIQVDKSTGAALQTLSLGSLPSVGGGLSAAWAFAFWGGSFYIFYMVEPPDSSTNVYKLETNGTLVTTIANTGMRIVGAGVSTCAPVVPPE